MGGYKRGRKYVGDRVAVGQLDAKWRIRVRTAGREKAVAVVGVNDLGAIYFRFVLNLESTFPSTKGFREENTSGVRVLNTHLPSYKVEKQTKGTYSRSHYTRCTDVVFLLF